MSLFLLTTELDEKKFVETLIETNSIVSLRIFSMGSDEFGISIEDSNNSQWSARFKTEASMRARFKELLQTMGADTSFADTMKVDLKLNKHKELSSKLEELIRNM